MVLFNNINTNQRVEVRRKGHICTGTVRFKGCLNGKQGDWVGVALDQPVGNHDGMLNGRRYFFCPPNCGIFTTAENIRFIAVNRSSFNKYRPIDRKVLVDEELFGPGRYYSELDEDRWREAYVSNTFSELAKTAFKDDKVSNYIRPNKYHHHLQHTVSKSIPAVTMLRPQTAKACITYAPGPVHEFYDEQRDDFISSPSIPVIHQPKTAKNRLTKSALEKSDRLTQLEREFESLREQDYNTLAAQIYTHRSSSSLSSSNSYPLTE